MRVLVRHGIGMVALKHRTLASWFLITLAVALVASRFGLSDSRCWPSRSDLVLA